MSFLLDFYEFAKNIILYLCPHQVKGKPSLFLYGQRDLNYRRRARLSGSEGRVREKESGGLFLADRMSGANEIESLCPHQR